MRINRKLRRLALRGKHPGAHMVIAFLSILTYSIFVALIPLTTPVSDLELSIQLLGQVLAVLTGALLIGATVYLSTFKDAEAITELASEIDKATELFFSKYFSGGTYHGHKLLRPAFLSTLLSITPSEFLFFPAAAHKESWIIYRPTWDGVWYRIYESPLVDVNPYPGWHFQMQTLHEVVICSEVVMGLVLRLRNSNAALISTNTGTQGSNDFIDYLATFSNEVTREKYSVETSEVMVAHLHGEEHFLSITPELSQQVSLVSKQYSEKVTRAALRSMDYFREEASEHSRNIGWTPAARTLFLTLYIDYLVTFAHLIDKLQILRLANVAARSINSVPEINASAERLIYPSLTEEMKSHLLQLRPKVIALRGSFAHVDNVRKASAAGLALSLLTLLALLLAWPIARAVLPVDHRLKAFAVLIALGSASLLEGVWFLRLLLAGKRMPNAPTPLHDA